MATVLKRPYPHDETYITDESFYNLPLTDNGNTGIRQMYIGLTGKGEDNKLITYKNVGDFVKRLGVPNFKLNGQAHKQAYDVLNEDGVVHFMRITAMNATYSNRVVLIKTKQQANVPVTDENGKQLYLHGDGSINDVKGTDGIPQAINKVIIKIALDHLDKLYTNDTLESDLFKKYSNVVDADGFKTYPLFIVTPKGRGLYGDYMRFRMVSALTTDRDSNYRNYTLETFINNNGLNKLDQPFVVSLNPNGQEFGSSSFIETVVSDFSNNLNVQFSENAYDLLIEELAKAYGPDEFIEDDIDFIYGSTREGQLSKHISIDPQSIDLSQAEGLALQGGTDGDFDVTNPNRQQAIDARLLEGFNGAIDDAIYNVWEYPVDIMIDANYPEDAKKALVALALKRDDCPVILDSGFKSTGTQALQWMLNKFNYDNWRVFFFTEAGKVKDNISLKNIPVTITYLLAPFLARHYKMHPLNTPICGLEYGNMDLFIKGTMTPKIADPDMQDLLYTKRLNFLEVYKENAFLNMMVSSQKKYSDLLFFNNVMTLFKLKRDLETLVKSRRYNFTDNNDILKFRNEAEVEIISNYRDNYLTNASLDITQTEYEKQVGIVNWSVDVTFKDMVLYNIINLRIL